MVREIQPNTTAAVSPDGQWIDEYVAYTSWAMRALARHPRDAELNRRAAQHTEDCR